VSAKLVYVAGPIGDSTDFRERFAQGKLEVQSLGYNAVTPVDVCSNSTHEGHCGHTWRDHMNGDIRTLLNCEGIYMLRNWEHSRGARLEKLIADGLDMFVLYQPDLPAEGAVKADNYQPT